MLRSGRLADTSSRTDDRMRQHHIHNIEKQKQKKNKISCLPDYRQTAPKYSAGKWMKKHDGAVKRVKTLLESRGLQVRTEYPLPTLFISLVGERDYKLDLLAFRGCRISDELDGTPGFHNLIFDGLIIAEFDGGYHTKPIQAAKDRIRDEGVKLFFNINDIHRFNVDDVYDLKNGYTDEQLLQRLGLAVATSS